MAERPALVARVLPDIRSGTKTFDYLVPDTLRAVVQIGDLVRVELHGRRVGGWVVALGVEPPPGVRLKPIAKWTGHGPPAEVLELAAWGAWRWAGRLAPLLVAASPPSAVPTVPAPPRRALAVGEPSDPVAREVLAQPASVVRLAPAADPLPLVAGIAATGNTLVVVPTIDQARLLAVRLGRSGVPVAVHPRDWAVGAAGATVIGTRTAVWAPVGQLRAIVVLDEHDDALQEGQTITWHARAVALERARRAGVPCVLVSPTPSLDALEEAPLLRPARTEERQGWPVLEVVDRSGDDPRRTSLVTDELLRHLRSGRRVACVLNAPGRARLLACASCGAVARCEVCEAAVGQDGEGRLVCRRCGTTRPVVCASCGATRMKLLRPGTARLREELEAAAGEAVAEVTAATTEPVPSGRLFVGTEAVLHRVGPVDVVAFLDLDAELLAPRFRAGEQALALLARAARQVGGRAGGGRILVQTRVPRHDVLDAVLHADPGRFAARERARRAALRWPPFSALAAVSGPAAPSFVAALGQPRGLEVLGPADGTWLLRAADHRTLCDALAAVPRPSGRLRLEVDPLRV